MAGLMIDWRWANPTVVVPQGSRFRTSGAADAFSDVADSITKVKQSNYREEQNRLARERQAMLDQQAAEDRQRRIAEEERKKALYGEAAGILRKEGSDDLASLKEQQKQLMGQIAQIKNTWGI